jgi:hypothetical protein
MEVLKAKAKAAGLWNLWLPKDTNNGAGGGGLTNLEYAPLCEIMGSSMLAPEIFNCNGPTALPFFHSWRALRPPPPLRRSSLRNCTPAQPSYLHAPLTAPDTGNMEILSRFASDEVCLGCE